MAKENFVFLHGQLYQNPSVYVDEYGRPKKAAMAIKVLRRPPVKAAGEITNGKLRVDVPIIMTMDEFLIRECAKLKKGDMVDIKGVYTSREINKKAICPNGHEHIWRGNFVFITPIYICQREQGLDSHQGFELLKQRTEISNLVMLIGTLCREPELVEFDKGDGQTTKICQYQLASNRRFFIRDGAHESEKTDYPWVKTSGDQALEDMAKLHTGSLVFLNAAIQTRDIDRELVCPVCEEKYTIKESVCELYPYAVEYLRNCDGIGTTSDTTANTVSNVADINTVPTTAEEAKE